MSAMQQRPVHAQTADEADLICRAKQNDNTAVRLIIQRHNRRLYRIARSVLRDDSEAEDVVQEAYVRAFTKLAQFRADSSLGGWLSRIVLNEALGRLRRRRTGVNGGALQKGQQYHGESSSSSLADVQLDPERIVAQHEIHGLVEAAIDHLPEGFRTVLVARVIEEMSVEETAQLLGLRPETVKTRLNRARNLLRKTLETDVGSLTNAFPFGGARCQRIADCVLGQLRLS